MSHLIYSANDCISYSLWKLSVLSGATERKKDIAFSVCIKNPLDLEQNYGYELPLVFPEKIFQESNRVPACVA